MNNLENLDPVFRKVIDEYATSQHVDPVTITLLKIYFSLCVRTAGDIIEIVSLLASHSSMEEKVVFIEEKFGREFLIQNMNIPRDKFETRKA